MISGKDSLTLLNKVYTNNFSNLGIGKIKYGLLLKEDVSFDDGTTTKLSENRYLMTTTTSNAALVLIGLKSGYKLNGQI